MTYAVATPVFSGPFDLLLHLILRREVDLYEVSLIDIVDAYCRHVEQLQLADDVALDLEMATEFLLIAATLVQLKVRRLLPEDERVDLDEEFALWEERDLLLARLLEAKTFKDAAAVLARFEAEASRSVPRRAGPDERYDGLAPDLLEGVGPQDLLRAFCKATTPRPVVRVETHHIAPIRVSVADAVAELSGELPVLGRVTFRRLTDDLVDRIEVVVRFLAVLELFKQGLVDLDQATSFGELGVRWIGPRDGVADFAALDSYEG